MATTAPLPANSGAIATKTKFWRDYLKPISIRGAVPLFAWNLLTQFVDQKLLDATQLELSSHSGPSAMLWLFGGLSLFTSILGPLISIVIVFFCIQPHHQRLNFFINQTPWLVKEQLRAMGKVILWGLLLILPGVWKFLEFVLLPFVVCLDPNYRLGRIDALRSAKGLFYRNWFVVLPLLFGFLFVNFLLTSFDELRSFSDHPATATGFVSVDVIMFLILQWLLLRVWERDFARQLNIQRS